MNGHRESFLDVMTSSSRRSRDESGCDVTAYSKQLESRKPEDHRLVRVLKAFLVEVDVIKATVTADTTG